ncbi:MAG: IS1380 family transposase [Flavobacteriaceae bacterium]|nr:IS1380 family transposase [Flavobacteriaceae bacterium]
MKSTTKFINGKIKSIKHSFTGGNITMYSGINIVAKYLKRDKTTKRISKLFPTRKENATKFTKFQVIMAITFASLAGVNRIKKIANFTQDPLIQANLGLGKALNENVISSTLKTMGQSGARELEEELLKKNSIFLKNIGITKAIFDGDSTVSMTFGNQEGAKKGFNSKKKGAKSYHPQLLFESNSKILYNTWFRSGDSHTGNGMSEFLKETQASLPDTIENVFFRADSGYFGGKLLDTLEGFFWDYLIKVKLKNLTQLLKKQEWTAILGKKDIAICEFDYTTKSWAGTVRKLKAIRTVKEYVETDFLGDRQIVPVYQYACYVSSYIQKDATELHDLYKERSTSETWIEQVKGQLLAGKTLTDDFWANDILWQLNCFAYNISVMMRNKHKKFKKQEHQTFREWFIVVPGKIVSGGHTKEVKIYENYYCKSNWIEFDDFLNAA